ncbi:hypothetical protein HOF56_00365 [Candidatus Peribacteria bacterium]|jgi:hypothetical protein|nr:hypothetical protein [Candidatus Peribacteria bacterium]MBT4021588.1 hypothetical protein [Candidatus Peribacteria bacterium]MBT4240748.1 hypothetical protein [Candidatus Peribacteria bacterium]MBT4474302.1 hypothetical protein [Candidatus Peribacteria bacterium]
MIITREPISIENFTENRPLKEWDSPDDLSDDERSAMDTLGDRLGTEEKIAMTAWQMRSPNFGCGGRIIEMPTEEQLASVTVTEEMTARVYIFRLFQKQNV